MQAASAFRRNRALRRSLAHRRNLAFWLLAALTACGGGQPAQKPAGAAPSILLVTVDTTRFDAVGSGRPGDTGAVKALETRGVRFTQAYATVPATLPSILTPLQPWASKLNLFRHATKTQSPFDIKVMMDVGSTYGGHFPYPAMLTGGVSSPNGTDEVPTINADYPSIDQIYADNLLTQGVANAGLNVGCRLTDHVRLYAGYTFLLWDSPMRSGDQIDLVINGSSRPAIPFKEDLFWAQGLNAGFEVTW